MYGVIWTGHGPERAAGCGLWVVGCLRAIGYRSIGYRDGTGVLLRHGEMIECAHGTTTTIKYNRTS